MVDGAPALVLQWRTTFLRFPLAVGVFTVFLGCAFAVAMFQGGSSAGWFGVLIAVPLALALPDSVLRNTRDARLVLTPPGIGARGWEGDSWLDWDDVVGVEFVDAPQHSVLRVVGTPNAPSRQWRRRRRFLYSNIAIRRFAHVLPPFGVCFVIRSPACYYP